MSVTGADALPRIGLPSWITQKMVVHGAVISRAPSPNVTPSVLRPSPLGRVALTVGAKAPAHPVRSDGWPLMTNTSHGYVPLPSTSTACWVTPLELPAIPSMSGSVAVRFSVTAGLLVNAAPLLMATVPVGGVASMRVCPLALTKDAGPSDVHRAALWHAATVMS